VGFLDAILGRSKPPQPNLDALFSLPTAALTLEAAAEMHPTGVGAVCFRQAEGGAFSRIRDDVGKLVQGAEPEESTDDYGYTWITVRREPSDMTSLCTDLHAVNSTLESAGFGPSLLCTTIGLRSDKGKRLGLVYLYKRGTFFPFAPVNSARQQRDNALELQVRSLVDGDLQIEKDVSRWFPVWGAPGI